MTDASEELDEETRPQWSSKDDPDGLTEKDVRKYDVALAGLLRMTVNLDEDNSIGLSVLVRGELISGMAIHPTAWRKRITAQVREAGSEKSPTERLADAVDEYLGMLMEQRQAFVGRRNDAGLPEPKLSFLHFRDARIHSSSPVDLPLVRVKLSDVSAWALGSHNSRES